MDGRSIARGMRSNRHPLDQDSATRLLQGTVHPDDAPPGYAPVADLLATAASVPAVDEEAGLATITAMVEAIRASAPIPDTPRRRSMIGKLLAGKAALAAVAFVGLTATGAAAASGSLPDPVQGVVSDAVSHVGVDIPHPHGKSADHRQDAKHDGSDDPAADDQSGDEGKGMSDTVADLKTNRADDAGPLGQDVCAIASDGKCHSGDNHKGGEDESTPPESSGNENRGKSGEEHGRADGDDDSTPTTGSIDTGADNSGRDLPSDKGKPDSDS
jgi:hypothetical protein